MFKLFDYLLGKNDKTEVSVRVKHYEPIGIKEPYISNSSWTCSSVEDFEKIYNQFCDERKKLLSKIPDIQIKIELSGKLKGDDLKKEFNDLNTFHQFLKENMLVNNNKSTLQLGKPT